MSRVTPLGEGSRKLAAGFLGLGPTCLFSLPILLCINGIDHSHEFNCMLSPASLLSASAHPGWSWRLLTQVSPPQTTSHPYG